MDQIVLGESNIYIYKMGSWKRMYVNKDLLIIEVYGPCTFDIEGH